MQVGIKIQKNVLLCDFVMLSQKYLAELIRLLRLTRQMRSRDDRFFSNWFQILKATTMMRNDRNDEKRPATITIGDDLGSHKYTPER
jgi:hypothetical protein